jgi:long-chain acyl-CoA synthetase
MASSAGDSGAHPESGRARLGVYDSRPWLALYPPAYPKTIEPAHRDALSMFRATAARLPAAPAIHYFDHAITFEQLDRMSDALAAVLQDAGFGRGDRLANYLQNVPQFAISLLAAWKCGGIGVSVNPMLKQEELAKILGDCGATVLVTLESLWREVACGVVDRLGVQTSITTSELDFLGGEVPSLLSASRRDRDASTLDLAELIAEHDGRAPAPVQLAAEDVAILTYTSGTTGPAKGAIGSHRNVVFNAQTYQTWGALSEADIVLDAAPLFHITGLIAHLAVAFLTGMPQVMFFRFDPDVALEMIERHRCTFTVAAITAYTSLTHAQSFATRDVSSLRKLMSGGAPIPPAGAEALERALGAYVHNVYGLTETTSPSHFVPYGTRAPVDPVSGALSVGVPVFNTTVRLCDEHGNDVEPGQVGEVLTSGPQVVSGYWEKPEETRLAIVEGELRTGDVGAMDDEGWFYLVDRKKDQINAAGYKVWPREVEDVLYRHEAIREAAVVGVPDDYRGETVKAFVSLEPGATAEPAELIAFCKERMAAYKYPRAIEVLDELPKTVSGKILRRELREREAGS